MIVDPVCGKTSLMSSTPTEKMSLECAQKFRENPARYALGHDDLGEPFPITR